MKNADSKDLVAFLRARLAVDEHEIKKHRDDTDDLIDSWTIAATGDTDSPSGPHLRISKKRALHEVELMRWLIDTNASVAGNAWLEDLEARTRAEEVLRRLAGVYADHPDYRAEWRS